MNNEIMEILDYLKDENEYYNEPEQVIVDCGEIILEREDVNKLLDYITNLQKENERLKNNYNDNEQAIHKIMEENEKLKDELKYTIPQVEHNQIVSKLCREKQEYKSRCEKAIEYIKTINSRPCKEDGTLFSTEELLNILGGDKE